MLKLNCNGDFIRDEGMLDPLFLLKSLVTKRCLRVLMIWLGDFYA